MRRENDYYPTPEWCARHIPVRLAGHTILDPCPGQGHLMRAIEKYHDPERVLGIELDAERAAIAGVPCSNALDENTSWPDVNMVVTNPPFSLAAEFVERAIRPINDIETNLCAVIMLLPISWLEPAKKRERLLLSGLDRIHVLPRRPSFTRDGRCASSAYAWFVWRPGGGHARVTWGAK